jgi:Na+-driven multidrug efflux pump
MRTLCRAVIGLYVLPCIAAIAIVPLNAAGLAREPDPLSGIFAVLLAAPWIWLLDPLFSDSGVVWNLVLAAACMALNAAIMWAICNWATRRKHASSP